MFESRALLSQQEIDALIKFLRENKCGPLGGVLDQTSIDRLIELIKLNNSQGIYYDGSNMGVFGSREIVLLDSTSNIAEQRNQCVLECSFAENGYIEVYCVDTVRRKFYKITPDFLKTKRVSSDDDSQWGYAIAPVFFEQIAASLGVTYSIETYEKVYKGFSRLMYGNDRTLISDLYCV